MRIRCFASFPGAGRLMKSSVSLAQRAESVTAT
jgi:hypothetical protein